MSQHDRTFAITFVGVLGFLVVLAVVFYFIANSVVKTGGSAGENTQATQIADENIKPVGAVTVADQSGASAASAGPRSGAEVYNAVCMACHGTGAAGAPKVGDKAAWAPRHAQGIDTLNSNAINGIRAMPPKGTCGDCSDDELKGAVAYMLNESGFKVTVAAAPAAAAPAAASADAGKQIYDASCMACHSTGAAGAPKVGDKAAWAPRIAQGVDTLVNHAINGIRAMPPKGTCMSCSDDDLKAAVSYMVNESK
ncbi:MAG: cytochrome c5 family protein [Gammaproteobacteria bacterium]|nr:cytochrome c5 family protein [Gammaproteobacteria bacterium]